MNPPASLPKPRQVVGIDIRRLPLGPQDAFVLSRVDGNATIREIGYATSLSEEQVAECLGRLASLGAIEYLDAPHASKEAMMPPPVTPTASATPTVLPNSGTVRITDAAPLYDESELHAASDLDLTRRREILELYYRLDTLDHYQLLGLERNVERKAIKVAYYEKVKTFHPDRYFGKNLGGFRSKLEACFARLTQAHDTLVSALSREEYDGYLDAQRQTRELERALSQSITLDDLNQLEQRMEAAFATPLAAVSVERPAADEAAAPNPPSAPLSAPPSSSVVPKMSDEERRRHLAYKLRLSSASLRAPPRSASSSPPISAPSREQIAEQLRRQLGGAKREEQMRQLDQQLAAADAAMAANDPVAASNALRIAQSLAPANPAIGERLAQSQALAAAALSDTYLRQGEYEEKSGRYEAAARSYERAARGRPAATTWEAAARCLLAAQTDLRTASEFAKQAIAMAPERAASRLLLGQIFLAARMRTSAISELERARRLDPNNDTVVSLLKRIANDEI